MQTTIERLFVYPVKSLSGVPVQNLYFDDSGPRDDRKYLLVNSAGRFISQRSHPILATFQLDADESGWLVTAPDYSTVMLPKDTYSEKAIEVSVWRDTITAYEVDRSISNWFSRHLDEMVFLVTLDELSSRTKAFNGTTGNFAFADGYPLLVCNTSTLDHLNSQTKQRLSMRRFRPNIVITIESQQEYELSGLKMEQGGIIVFGKHCVRCNIPAIDPETGVFQRETHKLIKDNLSRDGSVIFGVNAISHNLKNVQLGDKLTGY
jgi:uncharacterized protein YcbX